MKQVHYITPAEVKDLFTRGGEFAVLDVREQEEFSREHMLLASCAPLSRLDMMVLDLVPCRAVPVILVDSGREADLRRAERACSVLMELGYRESMILRGGIQAWKEAGYVVFTGVGALSKGFGEYVETVQGTPRLPPEEVRAVMESGDPFVVIDVRPCDEYAIMNIPGGINAPGCEVVYRFEDLVPGPETTVIINCAGRTRSIIGTQTLRNIGIPNKVVALKGGTMNWRLAGYSLDHGNTRRTAAPSAKAVDAARRRAAAVAAKYRVSFVDARTLDQWKAEADIRALYIFDVRQPEEFAAGHLPGSRNAQGGQLVQATDEYAAVRNARFVLVDDTEVRAVMTAHWLLQMGLPHVSVLRGGLGGSGLGGRGLASGAAAPTLPPLPLVPAITAWALHQKLAGPVPPLVINTGVSKIHRKGHVPGAVWVARAYLGRALAAYPEARDIVICSDSDEHALLSAQDATRLWTGSEVRVLQGGTAVWAAQEFPMEEGMPTALCAEDDVWYKPYTDSKAEPEAMQGYFDWEFGLVERIWEDGDVRFTLLDE